MPRSVVVLRHASAGVRASWSGDDRCRPLDSIGIEQSLDLVAPLDVIPLSEIRTSPFARCHHTVSPLAAARRLPVITASWLSPDAPTADVEAGVAKLEGDVVLCTHRERLPSLLAALTGGSPEGQPALERAEALVISYDDAGAVTETVTIPAPTPATLDPRSPTPC